MSMQITTSFRGIQTEKKVTCHFSVQGIVPGIAFSLSKEVLHFSQPENPFGRHLAQYFEILSLLLKRKKPTILQMHTLQCFGFQQTFSLAQGKKKFTQ